MTRKAGKKKAAGRRRNGEGTVRQVGVRWRWEFMIGKKPDGKRDVLSGYCDTEDAAYIALADAVTNFRRGQLASPDKVTCREYAATWLKRQNEVTPRTRKKYGQELEYVLEQIGHMRVQEVKTKHLKDVVVKLAEREMNHGKAMSRSTLGRTLTRMRSMFEEAVSDQVIYVNPMTGVKMPKATPANANAQEKALNPEQATRLRLIGSMLYEAGHARLWPALFLGLNMGLRRGEIMGLMWKDINFERGTMSIVRTRVMDVKGITISKPKTKNSIRVLHMPPSVVALLKGHQEHQCQERAKVGRDWNDIGAVFATEFGNWTHPDNLNRALKAVIGWTDPVKAAKTGRGSPWQGISREVRAALQPIILEGERLPGISPHDLRHTYATLALRNGSPANVVSKNLGHTTVNITLSTYRHVLDDELRANIIDLFPEPVKRPQAAAPLLN